MWVVIDPESKSKSIAVKEQGVCDPFSLDCPYFESLVDLAPDVPKLFYENGKKRLFSILPHEIIDGTKEDYTKIKGKIEEIFGDTKPDMYFLHSVFKKRLSAFKEFKGDGGIYYALLNGTIIDYLVWQRKFLEKYNSGSDNCDDRIITLVELVK